MLGIILRFWLWLSYLSFDRATSVMSSRQKSGFVRCLLKMRYKTVAECLASIGRNHQGAGSCYQCAYCNGWHKTNRGFKQKYANTHDAIRSIRLWEVYNSRGLTQERRERGENQQGRSSEDVNSQVEPPSGEMDNRS